MLVSDSAHQSNPCIFGYLKARSPIFKVGKNGRYAILLVIVGKVSHDTEATFPLFVDCNDLLEAEAMVLRFWPCSYYNFSNLQLFKVSFEANSRFYCLKFVPSSSFLSSDLCEDCGLLVPASLLKARLLHSADLVDLLTFSGTVVKVETNLLVLDHSDREIVIIGFNGCKLKCGDSLSITNPVSLLNSETLVRSLQTKYLLSEAYYFVPYVTSLRLNDKEVPFTTTHCPLIFGHDLIQASIRQIITNNFNSMSQEIQNKLFNALLPSVNVPVAFLSYFTSDLNDLRVKNLLSVRELLQFDTRKKPTSSRIFVGRLELDGIVIGLVKQCPISGLFYLHDSNHKILIHHPCLVPEAFMVIKTADLVIERYLVDPIVDLCCERRCLDIQSHKYLTEEQKLKPSVGEFHLFTVNEIFPPEVCRLSSVPHITGRINGIKLGLLTIAGNEAIHNIKAYKSSPFDFDIDACNFMNSKLAPGKFYFISKDYLNTKNFSSIIEVSLEKDSGLMKGSCTFDHDKKVLSLSETAYNYFMDRRCAILPPENIESLLCSVERRIVSFQGVLDDIDIHFDKNVVQRNSDLNMRKLFESYSIGLPIPGAQLLLKVRDIRGMDVVGVFLDILNRAVLPVGLVKGALVSGSHFVWTDGKLRTGPNSLLTVLETKPKDLELAMPIRDLTAIPFYFLSDFIGFQLRSPCPPVQVNCSILSFIELTFEAFCSKCDSPIVQRRCQIHDTDFCHVFKGSMKCAVTDGTLNGVIVTDKWEHVKILLGIQDADEMSIQSQLRGRGEHFLFEKNNREQEMARLAESFPKLYDLLHRSLSQRFMVVAIPLKVLRKAYRQDELKTKRIPNGRQFVQVSVCPDTVQLKVISASVVKYAQETRKLLSLIESNT